MNIKIDTNVCRVCLQSGQGAQLFGAPNFFERKFKLITQLQIAKGDGLPELLCAKCVARLKIAHAFRVQSHASQNHLKQFLENVNKFKEPNFDVDESEDYVEEILEAAYEELNIPAPQKTKVVPVSIKAAVTTTSSPSSTPTTTPIVDDAVPQRPQTIQIRQSLRNNKPIHNKVQQIKPKLIKTEPSQSTENVAATDHHDDHDLTSEGQHSEEESNQLDEASFDEPIEEEHLEAEDMDVDVKPVAKKRRGRKAQLPSTDAPHVCETCNKDFSTRTNLLRHLLTHDGGKPFICPICGNGFTQNGSLKQHMHIHTGDRPFQCEFCSRGFTQAKSLVFHMRRHTGEKPYGCSECNMSFRQKDGLKRHYSVKHSNEPKETFTCEVCGKVLQSKYSINSHMVKHYKNGEADALKIENVICSEPQCERGFATQSALDAHQRQHSTMRLTKCTICKKEFNNKAALMEHFVTHKMPKPEHEDHVDGDEEGEHKCTECGSEFKQASHLHVHISMHHSQRAKRFVCQFCGKSYAIEKNLARHMIMHEKDEKFEKVEEVEVLEDELICGDDNDNDSVQQCGLCTLGFATKDQLREHQLGDHPEEVEIIYENDALDIVVECPTCTMKFSDVVELNAHVLTTHDDRKCEECGEEFQSQRLLDEHKLEHDLTA